MMPDVATVFNFRKTLIVSYVVVVAMKKSYSNNI